jgi:hypothetical protein
MSWRAVRITAFLVVFWEPCHAGLSRPGAQAMEQCLKPVDEREGRTFPVIE